MNTSRKPDSFAQLDDSALLTWRARTGPSWNDCRRARPLIKRCPRCMTRAWTNSWNAPAAHGRRTDKERQSWMHAPVCWP
jgi:hypothetical protein